MAEAQPNVDPKIRNLRLAEACQSRPPRLHLDGFMLALLKEFLQFLVQEKKWWLLPLVFILLALGALMVFSSGSVLSPFLYPLM